MILNIRLSLSSLIRRIISRRFLKFGTVGASGTVINMGLLYVSQEYFFSSVASVEVRLNMSLAVAIFFATLNNFFWNRLWTWADRKQHHDRPLPVQFGQYTASCSISIALQTLFTNLLAPHVYYLLGNLIAIGLSSVLNFLLNDLWTFGRLKWSRRRSLVPPANPTTDVDKR